MKTQLFVAGCLIINVFIASSAMCSEEPSALPSVGAEGSINIANNTQSNPICVVYARLTEFKPYMQKAGFPEPPEATLDIGIFKVLEVVRGNIDTPSVCIPYSPNTLRGLLPTNAILVLTHMEGTRANYDPVGGEAWRGILPDTLETRARIESLTDEELSRTPTGKEIPETAARQIALNKLEILNDYTGFSGKYKFSTAERKPFGWFFWVYVLDERESPASVISVMVSISDEGEVVACWINGFGSDYAASEWDSIPEL
jgi:hypothetical protein